MQKMVGWIKGRQETPLLPDRPLGKVLGENFVNLKVSITQGAIEIRLMPFFLLRIVSGSPLPLG